MTASKSGHGPKRPWWKSHEIVSALFGRLVRPLETEVLHDTRQMDVVGKLRRLDVGVIDPTAGEQRVIALVEVQKRKTKVALDHFGDWIYKRRRTRIGTAPASTRSSSMPGKQMLERAGAARGAHAYAATAACRGAARAHPAARRGRTQ